MYNDFGPAAFTTLETGSLACQGSQGVEVAYNWFHGTAGLTSGDIVMEYDFGARHYIVHHNVFWQGKTIVQGYKTGFHWTFDWNDTGSSASTANAGGAMCFNNTVVDSSDVAHRDWDLFWPGYKKNNIMVMSDTSFWKFTDAINRNYTLRDGSPAIDKGEIIPGWVESYKGKAPDLGAYESGESRWVAGANWKESQWQYPPLSVNSATQLSLASVSQMPTIIFHGTLVSISAGNQSVSWKLINAAGQISKAGKTISGKSTAICLSSIRPGLYILQIRGTNMWAAQKSLIRMQ